MGDSLHVRPELPTGTVTFLFTDVEGSTRLLHELGDGYAAVLAEHRRFLRAAFRAHGGVEVDTQGDAFFYAFGRPSDALKAAEEGRRALEPTPVRVRMGVHTGEPLVTDEGYVGMDVHKGARVASAGHGGQVLVSEQAARLADPGSSGSLVDLGLHRLKDLTAPERLYQLGPGEFPPLKTLNATNLPVAGGALLGREAELAGLLSLLRDGARLVTVTGPGGTGKTRFALQGAAELVDDFADGVFWVPLAEVLDPALVVPQIGQTLGVTGGLAGHVGDRRLLLLLDNLEQVLAAAPDLSALLAACPQVRLLVTSRAPLRIEGERELPLEPLAEPAAVELFCERARAVGRPLMPDETVSAICARLDNLPLAVELAAARTRLLAPAALLARLDTRLPLLTGGRRDAPERQRTLRATIEWSHELLDREVQELFTRLAVFSGSFSLPAAEEVCAADLDALAALVELNLLKPVAEERFLMLETIREYADERLQGSADAAALRRRHAEYYLDLAEAANLSTEAVELAPSREELLIPERANLAAAVTWATVAGESLLAGRLVAALELFYCAQSPFEGIERTAAVLELELPTRLRARLLRDLGSVADPAGRHDEAELAYRASLEFFQDLGDEAAVAHLLMRLGFSAARRGELEQAEALAEQSLARSRAVGARTTQGQALELLSGIAERRGRLELALEQLRESLGLIGNAGSAWLRAGRLEVMADLLFRLGRLEEAEHWARESVRRAHEIRSRQLCVFGLARLAAVAVARGDDRRAGLLWGAVEAEEVRGPLGTWDRYRPAVEQDVLRGSAEFEAARTTGRALPFDEAVVKALAED